MLQYKFNKFSLLLAIACLFLLCSYAIADELKVYPCSPMTEEPVLDGRGDDFAWNNIPLAEGFTIINTEGIFSNKQTSFKMGYDNTFLYIFIKCEEPNMNKIKAELGDMEEVWRDNCVEIFLQPEGDGYYQFIVNSIGSRWNGFYINSKNSVKELGDWTAVTYEGHDFWNIELAIPFNYLRSKPEGEWRGNIARSIRTIQESTNTTWAQMSTGYHEFLNFGRIVFMKEILTEEQVTVVENKTSKFTHNLIELEIKKRLDELLELRTFFERASEVQKNRDIVRIMALIDSFSKENQDIEDLSLSEKIIVLDKAKIIYNEAGKLRSRLMLEMLIFGEI